MLLTAAWTITIDQWIKLVDSNTVVYVASEEVETKVDLTEDHNWTEDRIKEKIKDTFPEDPQTAIAIAKCESRFNPMAYNDQSDDGGVFQINQVHLPRLEQLELDRFDVEDNITFARMLYEERGWKPWVCYTRNMI